MSVCLAVEREENSDHVDHCHGDILSISDVITGIGRSVRLRGRYMLVKWAVGNREVTRSIVTASLQVD